MNDDDLTIPLFPTPTPEAPPPTTTTALPEAPPPVIPSAEGPPAEGPPETERPTPTPVVPSPSLVPTADPDQTSPATNEPGPPSEEELKILDLHLKGYGTRKIASALGRDRKLVRRVLVEAGCDLGEPTRAALHAVAKGLAPAG